MKYGEYIYPYLPKGLAEILEFNEGDVTTLILKKDGKEYRALAHVGAIDGTVVIYPQKIEAGGALLGAFGFEAGDYILTLKGVSDPCFFFSTAKEIAESLTLDSTRSKYLSEFLSYNERGICIIEYEKIGGEPHYKVWDSNLETVTLKSYGAGVYALRIEQPPWEDLAEVFTTKYSETPIEYRVEKGKGVVSIKDSSVSAEPVYNYGIEIKNEKGRVTSGAILWKLRLGSNKELWVAVTIDLDEGKWLSKTEYVSEPHGYLVKDVKYAREYFKDLSGEQIERKILKIYYEDNRGHVNTHCMCLDRQEGSLKTSSSALKVQNMH